MWNRIHILLLVFLAVGIPKSLAQELANIIIRPEGQLQSQPAGKGFVLTCQGESVNPEHFTEMKWTGPKGEEIKEGTTGPVEVTRSGSNLVLVFKNPTTEETGTYNCSAMYDNTKSLHSGVQIVFYQDITWENCEQKQPLVINSVGKISCRVSANPSATYTWSKDGHALDLDHYATDANGVTVQNVKNEDAGTYMIRAMVTLTGRFQSKTITVEVHVPPEITEIQDKAELVEGDSATLSCSATGYPLPQYYWFDAKQRKLNGEEGYQIDENRGTLTIASVRTDDRGSLTCMAQNDAGEAKRSVDISIIVKPKIVTFENITTQENGEITFECHAEGDPLPQLSIRKEGLIQPYNDQDDSVILSRSEEDGRQVLKMTLKRAMRTDDGLYYCIAENRGSSVERAGHLTVEFAPIMTSTPSTIVKTWNGNPTNLTCIAEAIPNATITWSYQGQEIRFDNPMYVVYGTASHSNLLVKPSRDYSAQNNVYGTYKCSAENKLGTKSINIELQEARTPGSILETNIEKKTATTLTFKFNGPIEDGGLPIRSFVTQYRREGEPIDQERQFSWSEGTPYIIEDLQPRTSYIFRFAAKNDVGIGSYTSELPIKTPEESTPEAPKFITPGGNVSRYHNKFEVRWTVPLDNGREIDYFQLRYFLVEKRGGQYKSVGKDILKDINDWKNAPRFEITDLQPNSYYKVEVRAHNSIGFSQDTYMIFRTAEGSSPDEQRIKAGGADEGSVSMAAIIGIIVLLVLLVLIIMDVVCFMRYQWGFFFLLRIMLCGKTGISDKVKEASVEDGKGKDPGFGESSPMINDGSTNGGKDKLNDNGLDIEIKNKSPKGSKSSIAKDSLV